VGEEEDGRGLQIPCTDEISGKRGRLNKKKELAEKKWQGGSMEKERDKGSGNLFLQTQRGGKKGWTDKT